MVKQGNDYLNRQIVERRSSCCAILLPLRVLFVDNLVVEEEKHVLLQCILICLDALYLFDYKPFEEKHLRKFLLSSYRTMLLALNLFTLSVSSWWTVLVF